MTNLVVNVPSEYISLGLVMQSALDQASKGKGKERHASEGEAYEDQIICEVARRVGLGYPLGQAVKKIYESQRLIPQLGVQELLGAMNYLAAAVIVMQERMEEEGQRFREGFAHAEGGRCQNGKDHANPLSFEEQAKTFAKHNPPEEPEGNHPENPDSSPEFRSGDRVQFRDEIPSTSEPHWFEGVYVERLSDGGHAVKFGPHGHVIHCSDKEIRLAPKAEGCEELVQKDLADECGGCLYRLAADAPQTPEETCQRIVDNNPSIYPRKPTGEELAEMAEEEKHG